jgi:hypothetical protein
MIDTCLTFPLLLLKIIIFLLTCGIIFWTDYSEEKNIFDTAKKRFKFKIHYWPYRYDDLMKKWFYGLLGALLAGEVGIYALHQFTAIPENLNDSLDLTVIAVCTFFAPKLLTK